MSLDCKGMKFSQLGDGVHDYSESVCCKCLNQFVYVSTNSSSATVPFVSAICTKRMLKERSRRVVITIVISMLAATVIILCYMCADV